MFYSKINLLKILFLMFYFFFSIAIRDVFCLTVGSDFAVGAMQSFVGFPTTENSTNRVANYAYMRNGFKLEDETTTCSFDSIFPVSGRVSLNGGSLYLNTDLRLTYSTNYETFGKIYGNNRILEYDTTMNTFCDLAHLGEMHNINLVINNDLSLEGNLQFVGNCNFEGRNKIVSLAQGTSIVIGKNSTLHIKDAIIVGFHDNNVRCVDGTGKIIYDNSTLILSSDYTYSIGVLEFKNNVDINGTYTFFLETNQTTTVAVNSKLQFNDDLSFAVGKKGYLNKKQPIYFEDKTSVLALNNANLLTGSQGLQITRGTFNLLGKVTIDIVSTGTSNGLIFGDGTLAGDMKIYCYPASSIHFLSGHFTYFNTSMTGIESRSAAACLIREPGCTFYIAQDCLFSNITLECVYVDSLIVADGQQVFYDNCNIILPGAKFFITGRRINDCTFLLESGQEIFVQDGVLPVSFMIEDSGNVIRGNGSIGGEIALISSTSELAMNLDGQVLNNITLGGGEISLDSNLNFGRGNLFLDAGTVDLSYNSLNLCTQDLNWTSTVYWDSFSGRINLNSNVFLSSTWTISGNCIIDGNDNILDLSLGGKIYIERGSTLIFRNIKIACFCGTNIACLDNSGTIVFDRVKCKLFGDYYFQKGHFEVDDYWEIYNWGQNTFHYQSPEQSIIRRCSTITLRPSVVFSYEPPTTDRNLIYMAGSESIIHMICATLHSTSTGLQLTKGELKVEEDCYIHSDATTKPEGIIWGDGLSLDNDLIIKICPSSELEVSSGFVVYKNLS